ncbi:MAG: serine hydrolase, partial [Gammaproteobacteria bacterium]|nr:serine hydrolase [Gammaproteobacteria bacterium]
IVGEALLEAGYPLVHTVGCASARAPRLVDLRWGDPSAPRLTLVGKGVCFDTGGLDIKPAAGMLAMKKDMGGAALMLALARCVMTLRLPVRLRLLVPAVEKMTVDTIFDVASLTKPVATATSIMILVEQGKLRLNDTIGKFIDAQNMVPLLFADQWDATAKRWKKNDIIEEERRQLAISVFTRGVLSVERERLTGIVTLTVDWRDRHQAADWANGLVAMANALWRQQVIDEAAQSIQYLTKELESTNTLEVRDAVYRLIEASMKQRTVATVRRDLLFKVLDKAVPPLANQLIRPRPLRYAAIGFVFGALLGAFVGFVRLIRRP